MSQSQWNERLVADCKARVKSELDQIEQQSGIKAREEAITQKIKQLETSIDPEDLLELYVYLVSSLVLHTRTAYLKSAKVKQTLHLAHTILLSRGIKEQSSRLSFLHGDLHMILSQIERQSGEHWQAAWHQFLAEHVTRGEVSGGRGFQLLSLANRALRLGYASTALQDLVAAEAELSGDHLERCRINQVRALRLCKQWQSCQQLAELLQKDRQLSKPIRNELIWELTLLELLQSHDLNPMLKLIKKGSEHYRTSYIIEASLWALVMPSKQWLSRIPILENLKRRKDLQLEKSDPFFLMAKTLQQCYDYDIPLVHRIRNLGQRLSEIRRLVNIDKEVLVWAAASRWLIRARCESLARLTLSEYRARSWTLSDGQSDDIFNLNLSQSEPDPSS